MSTSNTISKPFEREHNEQSPKICVQVEDRSAAIPLAEKTTTIHEKIGLKHRKNASKRPIDAIVMNEPEVAEVLTRGVTPIGFVFLLNKLY